MKRILCFLLVFALMFASGSALADRTVINRSKDRGITINKAGDNTVEAGISPTTGLELADVAAELPDGFLGMAVTGVYQPLMVQVTNSQSGTGNRAPWFASYADVIYESAKTKTGVTRYTMVYSDALPEWVGCTRSIRVQHVYIREEWGAPFVYHGHQSNPQNKKGTDVTAAIRSLG